LSTYHTLISPGRNQQGKRETDMDIEILINTFDMNIEALKNGKQKSEAEVRKNYIDPLFEALGWNIRNTGLYEHEKEVIAEYSAKDAFGNKKADYCFRLNGKNMFFVEAKDPYINIASNEKAAFQIRSYCWSAKVPLGILTDFEEFAVYDGGHEPKITDSTDTARINYFNYRQYKDKWKEIADVFSKQAVTDGSIEKYIKKAKRKKGIPVDEAFLKDMEHWREILAVNIASLNPELSRKEINFAVQRTIDRIVFLRICEDRGTEAHGIIKRLSVKRNIYPGLVKLFREADSRYNSGIFCFAKEKNRTEGIDTLTPNLKMDDSVLKTVIERLYYPSPYNFAVMPADILGQIYERFLGKVIEISRERKVSVEEKPEVRKAGGVYYTPTYIVDYIVKNTVDKLIEGKTPAQVAKMKFLDPACGSGSFLIQAYQHLLDWHLAWYSKNDLEKHIKGKRPVLVKDRKGSVRLGIGARKQILLNNIFGVDIDFQAVEVTKLSLLLKVLEGEDDLTMQQLGIFKERALPDLGKNIKCGNSLIGPDYYENMQMNLNNEDEILRVNAFDWNAEFAEVMGNGGFDAVIGNPPYGASLSEMETKYLLLNYQLQNYQLDSYLLFIEKSLILIKNKGLWGMIIPNTWLLNLQSDKIREYIFSKFQIENIIHYQRSVFLKATVDTEVIIIKKEIPSDTHQIKISVVEKKGNSYEHAIPQKRWQEYKGKPVNIFERSESKALADKLRKLQSLDNICIITQGAKPFQVGKGKPPQTRKILEEKPFISDIRKDSSFRPLLRGSLIQKYQILWNNNYWISFGDWLAEPRYSAGYDAPEKIVIRQTGDSLVAALDSRQFIVRDNLYTIIQRNENITLHYILGLLNSKLLNWFYQNIINPEKGEALAQVKRGHLAQLPIVTDLSNQKNISLHDSIVSLAEQMLLLYKQLHESKLPQQQAVLQRKTETTDEQIDKLVYKLYGLTDEEIKTVEAG